jgi:hypothetical protein
LAQDVDEKTVLKDDLLAAYDGAKRVLKLSERRKRG